MSLLSDVIIKHLLSVVETAFFAHEDEAKDALVSEVEYAATQLLNWVNSKVNSGGE